MLVGCITVSTIDEVLLEVEQIGSMADLIELRLDYLEEEALSHLGQVIAFSKLPLIFTFRKKEQGGKREIQESERLKKIEQLLTYEPTYFDLEADTDPTFIRKIGKQFPQIKLIGSYHSFDHTPQDLKAILDGMKNPHFSFYKIATKARSTLDMLQLMSFVQEADLPISCISMGEYGKSSRVLGPIFGNQMDYSGLNEDKELHRFSLKTLLETYHYRKLNRETKIFALIGDPVEKSPGDLFHNSRFKQNRVYIKLPLYGEETSEFFRIIQNLPFEGLSVTIPLKEVAFKLMDQMEPMAKEIGAVNTVKILNGQFFGFNTDGEGALNAIEEHFSVDGKHVAILGAGGSARAIAFEAKRRGAAVSIYNRTESRAKELAISLGCDGYRLDQLKNYDLLINTIPVESEIVPKMQKGRPVMDIIYEPKETPILKRAKELGCECIYGEEMFREQADLQQLIWN